MTDPLPPEVKARRFELRHRLGSGGFGEVYAAHDRERNEEIALKVLRRDDASALYRFKQEFRTLANLAHPNLITLHELIASDDEWLLSMELIRGGTFIDYVRPLMSRPLRDESHPVSPEDPTVSSPVPGQQSSHQRVTPRLALPIDTLDLDRLRSSVRQLVEAVQTLHANGILHLDIKPSNVLISEAGRVVVVDFGLAERFGSGRRDEYGAQIAGTPQYMSPEQAAALQPTEASDWYCVGALLYRALTGLNTFNGDSPEVIRRKLEGEPTPVDQLVDGVPEDLRTLCADLLRRDPALRPGGGEILARLGAAFPGAGTAFAAGPAVFVGRRAQLRSLESAFAEMSSGRPASVHITGKSGMGKTALARTFVDELRRRFQDAVILEGRCYEHEAVPFKAFDGLLDALTNHLSGMPDSDAAALLPRGVEVLSRMFPSLRRVRAIATAQERTRIADPNEQRRVAFAALREFFARVAEHFPLVIVIDDLQWGDVDSAALLDELRRPPAAPPLLLVACYRSDERETSACLRALLSAAQQRGDDSVQIEVAELDGDEARELASSLLPSGASADLAARIAADTGGNPFFIDQLAAQSQYGESEQRSLESMMSDRLMQLPPASRRFLEIVAVAGQPIGMPLAAAAASLESGAFDVFAVLRAARWLRSRPKHDVTELEPYHDRVRELIVAGLPAGVLASHHRRLALALEQAHTSDLESLMQHFRSAGDTEKALRYAIEAANQSAGSLAFDRAARLFQAAIDLEPVSEQLPVLYLRLGDALSMTGRVVDSAQAYLAAADLVRPVEGVDLRRRAGEQYLQGFHLERGLSLLQSSLSDAGMKVAATTTTALLALMARRLYLRVRGTRFRERAAADIPPRELQQLDLCSALCRGLGFTDSLRAVELQSRHLALALKVGEPFRVARALTMSAAADGLSERRRARAAQFLDQAIDLSERVQNHFGVGIVHSARGLLGLGDGRWIDARREFDAAVAVFREKCVAPPHATMLCHVYRLEALFSAGHLREYFAMIPEFSAECQGRGDLHAEVNLALRQFHLKCFAEDDIGGAEAELRRAQELLGDHKLLLTRNYFLFRKIELALYARDAHRAWALVSSGNRSLLAMRLFGFQALTTIAFERRAYAALAMASALSAQGRSAAAFQKSALRDARHIDAWRAPFGKPIAQLVRGAVALQRGDRSAADRLLASAEDGFSTNEMRLHAAVAQWRRGSALAGERGQRLIDTAAAWMSNEGVMNPQRLSGIVAPV